MALLTSKTYSPKTADKPAMPVTRATPHTDPPVIAQYDGNGFVVGGGVAIFHLASSRVVICSARDRRGTQYFFLPKGRRDAGEESGMGAEREGYEEVSLRNYYKLNQTRLDAMSSPVIATASFHSLLCTDNPKRIPAPTLRP
jgi:hypothetical protein